MDLSDVYGTTFFNIHEEYIDYRLLFMDQQKHILATTNAMKFVCTDDVCDLTYLLDPYVEIDITGWNLNYTYDNNTKIVYLRWNETVGRPVTVHSIITKETGATSTVICENTTALVSTGLHTCNLSGYTGTFYISVSSSESPWIQQLGAWISIADVNFVDLIGVKEAMFWTFGLCLTIVGFGLFSPVGAVIALCIGLVFTFMLGMSAISVGFLIGACCLSIFISWVMRQ